MLRYDPVAAAGLNNNAQCAATAQAERHGVLAQDRLPTQGRCATLGFDVQPRWGCGRIKAGLRVSGREPRARLATLGFAVQPRWGCGRYGLD